MAWDNDSGYTIRAARAFNLPEDQQAKVIITALIDDGPASKSFHSDGGIWGVLPGDVLLAVKPDEIKWVALIDLKHAVNIMGSIKSGSIVQLLISRRGETMTRYIRAQDRPTEK